MHYVHIAGYASPKTLTLLAILKLTLFGVYALLLYINVLARTKLPFLASCDLGRTWKVRH